LSGPTLFIVRLFGPIIYAIQWIVRRTLRIFGVKLDMAVDVLAAHEEIRGAVDYHHSEGLVETDDRRMLGGVLDLSDMDVSEIMVHRKSMVLLDAGLPARAFRLILHGYHWRSAIITGCARSAAEP